MPDELLRAGTILQHLGEVADELPEAVEPRTLTVVGGALMALLGLRDATRDVDSIERLGQETKAALERVATRHELAPKWLNDAAGRFRLTGFDPTTCAVLLARPSVACCVAGRTVPSQLIARSLMIDTESLARSSGPALPDGGLEADRHSDPPEERRHPLPSRTTPLWLHCGI